MREGAHLTKTGKALFGIWAVGAVFSLAISAGVIWAAVHFIRKFW